LKKISNLWQLMIGNRMRYVFSMLLMGVAVSFSLMIPIIVQTIIDSFIGGATIENEMASRLIELLNAQEFVRNNLWIAGLMIVMITAIHGFFLFLSNKMSAQASENTAKNMRDRLYDHIQRLPYDFHKNSDTGDLIQRVTSDVETIRRFLSVQMMEVGRAIFMVSIAVYIMLGISIKMTIAAMALAPVIFLFAFMFFKKIEGAFKILDEAEAKMSTVIQENLNGTRVIRAFAREKFEMEKFSIKNRDYSDKTFLLIKYLAYYWSISNFICFISIGLVLGSGIYYAYRGEISLGEIYIFVNYEYILLWPIRQLGRILTDLGKAVVSSNRIQEIFDYRPETENSNEKTPKIMGAIDFEEVSFSYPDDKNREILEGLSFSIRQGETTAIIGKTGSGKSSLIHLLVRLYDCDSGKIMIDGTDIKEISKKWLRQHIGIVLQEPFLYSKTIKENIDFRSINSQESIHKAAEIASIHQVIKDFDKGYETLVGEKGVTLSGGQKQRLAIARMLINDYPVMIFDDSLSAVDTETDIAIREALSMRKKDITTIIISHRVASVFKADQIIVLEEGKVAEMGSHDVLLANHGYYHDIWQMQMGDEQSLSELGR